MAFTKIAAAGIGSTETVTLHSLEVLNNATVGGVLTYEDVTNVDSIGIVTARAGVLVGSGITLSKDGDGFFTGIVTATTFSGSFTGSGANLTSLPAAQLTGTLPALDGSNLTGVASTDNIRTNTNATFLQNINVSGTSTVSGKFFLGHASSRTVGDRTHLIQIEGTALQDGGLSMVRNRNDEHSTSITLAKTRGSSTGANTIVQSGDSIGEFAFAAGDGTDVVTRAGRIHCEIDGTPGENDMPGRLILSTTADGAASPTERLRITSTGLIGVNVTPTSHNNTTAFQIHDTYNSQGYPRLRLTNQSTGSASSDGFEISLDGSNLHAIVRQRENADIHFYTNNTEKVRITSDGYMSRPLHPNFCARMSGSQNVSAQDVVIYDNVSSNYRRWNIGGHYSTTTGKFTAPIDGIYYFEGQVMTTGWSNNDNIQDLIFLNSSQGNVSYPRQRRSFFRTEDDANGYFTNSCAGQVQLSSGDTVWIQIQKNCTVTSQQFCYFTGWLVN